MYRFCDDLLDVFTNVVEMYEKSKISLSDFEEILSALEHIQAIYDYSNEVKE